MYNSYTNLDPHMVQRKNHGPPISSYMINDPAALGERTPFTFAMEKSVSQEAASFQFHVQPLDPLDTPFHNPRKRKRKVSFSRKCWTWDTMHYPCHCPWCEFRGCIILQKHLAAKKKIGKSTETREIFNIKASGWNFKVHKTMGNKFFY